MTDSARSRAVRNYRSRLAERGMARFEVLGRATDRQLIRAFAKRLSADDPEANRLRVTVRQSIGGETPRRSGILKALRRSPLVGTDVIALRPFEPGREVNL